MSSPPTSPPSDTSPRILVADDEPHIRELLARCLENEGYTCSLAPDAKQALQLLEEHDFTLLISDINMPGLTGMELLEVVRERYPDVAVILVTGVDDRKTAIRALQLGAFGYVIKPFDLNELAINVANAFERRRLTLLSQANQERLEEEVRKRTEEIRMREEEVALRLVAAAEYRDTETGAHIRRIGLCSAALAEILGWSARDVDDLKVSAMMHDIGKIGVPDNILLKPGPLTTEEFDVIKQHTIIGASILENSTIPMLMMAREIALSHHERWDGQGYPHGLAGESIPLSARIVAVVDVYDALVHHRVYRPAVPEEEVLELMEGERGLHFAPEIFDLFFDNLPTFRQIRQAVV
ncbi:MAG: response regulator [Thermoanaerobaculia bacterium]|nr:response regulator [Thermoanaerobaculia bacterium]